MRTFFQNMTRFTTILLALTSAGLALAGSDWRNALQNQGYYSSGPPMTMGVLAPPQPCDSTAATDLPSDTADQAEPPIVLVVLGTDELDAKKIDPQSILVNGVPPTQWAFMDVAAPTDTPSDPIEFALQCGSQDEGMSVQQQEQDKQQGGQESDGVVQKDKRDGHLDLILNFDRRKLREAFSDAADGEVVDLMLLGNLQEQFGGTLLEGSVSVIIRQEAP
jgi:hypothetical protein